jgi:hypothetical protein
MKEWEVLAGFSNYAIDKNGNVKNIKKHKLMSQSIQYSCYHVGIYDDENKYKYLATWKLVAKQFMVNANNLKYVGFKDGNTLNHSLSNLEYSSQKTKIKEPVLPKGYNSLAKCFRSTKCRGSRATRKRNMDDNYLTYKEVELLFEKQNGRCAISGIKLDMSYKLNAERNPFSPSIDRIDCNKGYNINNIRIVCMIVNFGLNQFGKEVFIEVCKATVAFNAD